MQKYTTRVSHQAAVASDVMGSGVEKKHWIRSSEEKWKFGIWRGLLKIEFRAL